MTETIPESPALPPGAEIIQPTRDDFTFDLVKKFAERLVEGTYDRLGPELGGNKIEAAENLRMKIRDSLRKKMPESKLLSKIYPTITREEEIEGYVGGIYHLIEEGQLLAIRQSGEIVSIIGIIDRGINWPDGRGTYEIGKIATLKEHEGKGFHKVLLKEAEQRIFSEHPDRPILTVTKNPKVMNNLKNTGWKEIPFDYGLGEADIDKSSTEYRVIEEIRKSINSFDPLTTQKWIRNKFSLFYLDPKSAQP